MSCRFIKNREVLDLNRNDTLTSFAHNLLCKLPLFRTACGGLVQRKRLNIVFSNGVAQSASRQSRETQAIGYDTRRRQGKELAESPTREKKQKALRLQCVSLEPNDTLAGSLISAQAHLPLFRTSCGEGELVESPTRGKRQKQKHRDCGAFVFGSPCWT